MNEVQMQAIAAIEKQQEGRKRDAAVATHAEASRLGMKKATVWWEDE